MTRGIRARDWLFRAASALRIATRSLLRARGVTLAAVAALAAGFALAAITVAVVNAYLLRGMPFPDADRLYHVAYAAAGEAEPRGLARLDWSTLDRVVEAVDASAPTRAYLGEAPERIEVMGLAVASGSTRLLGLAAALGRTLEDADFRTGAEPVVLLGDALWRTRFGADPAAVGRMLPLRRTLDAPPIEHRVVGVLPPDFRYARAYDRGPIDVAAPLHEPLTAYMVLLRAGVPPATAASRINDVVRRQATALPEGWTGVRLTSIHARYREGLQPILLAGTAFAGLMLLIVSLNVAVLMLLRALRRQHDIAVHLAVGARRSDILRMLAAESIVLCTAGLAAGVAVSASALRALAPLIEERLGRAAPGGTAAIAIDPAVLAILAAAGLAITLVLPVVPLLVRDHARLDQWLRAGRTMSEPRRTRHLRAALVAVQLGASLALLTGCALSIRSLLNLMRVDLGYRVTGLERARIALPAATYPDDASLLVFYERLLHELEPLPVPFAVASTIPFYEYPQQPIDIAGADGAADAAVTAVGPDYFDVLAIPLHDGRPFTTADRSGAEPVAIISASLAQRLWPRQSALGRRVRAPTGAGAGEWRTVVGVTRDVRQTHTDADLDDVFVPFLQAPSRFAPLYFAAPEPLQWLNLVRTRVAAIDPDVLISDDVTGSTSLAREADRLLAAPRFVRSLLLALGILALLVATLGVHAVTAYAAGQRARELAIRAALGATPRRLALLFVRDAAVVVGAGIGLGAFGAWGVGRLLQHQLFGVATLDARSLAAAAAIISITGLLASWLPGRAAARAADPSLLNQA